MLDEVTPMYASGSLPLTLMIDIIVYKQKHYVNVQYNISEILLCLIMYVATSQGLIFPYASFAASDISVYTGSGGLDVPCLVFFET